MTPSSAIYVGRVVHARLRPRRHRLSYACYWLLLDLDRLEDVSRRLRLFSLNRFNLIGLRNADHGTGTPSNFADQAREHLARAGIDSADCKIFLLSMPRILGYGFNPLSIYFCYRGDGVLAALIYEVHNTFAQRHNYLVATDDQGTRASHSCAKRFYVSPFLDMDLAYDFDVSEPATEVSLKIRVSDREGPLLVASLAGRREDLTDRALLKNFFVHPLLTVKVVAAIHWEALRLWWKGVPLVPRPEPPLEPVTQISSRQRAKVFHE